MITKHANADRKHRSMPSYSWITLVLATVLPAISASSSHSFVCRQPDSFTVQLSDGRSVVVYGAQLSVNNTEQLAVYTYPDTKAVNILLNNTEINFRGYLLPESSNGGVIPLPEQIFWRSSGRTIGIGELENIDNEEYVLYGCRFYLPWDSNGTPGLPSAVETDIRLAAASCLKARVCTNIGVVNKENLRSSDNAAQFGPLSVYTLSEIQNYQNTKDTAEDKTQDIYIKVNDLVDTGIKKAIKKLKRDGQSRVKIADIQGNFPSSSGMFKGHFEATDGTFEDLSTLKRTTDAILSTTERRYSISCGFGLAKAYLNYEHYKYKYSFISVTGRMSGDVDGLKIEGKLFIDYSQNNCTSGIEYFKVTDMGKPKIKITGLGALNHLASKLLSWVTTKWQPEIIELIESGVKKVVEKQIATNFDCEKYIRQ